MPEGREVLRWTFAGGIAGFAVESSLFPLDTIKTRLQSQQGFQAAGGFKNLYRGLSSVALGSAPTAAIFFLIYSNLKEIITVQRKDSLSNYNNMIYILKNFSNNSG